jgi:hypothetical protein
MQHSNRPYLELDLARRALEAIRAATTLAEIEEHWKDYLRRLERVWNKSVSHFGKSPKWNGWQGPFLKLRKHDPLLSYLINARGADEHTIADITKKKPGTLRVDLGVSRSVHIKKLEIVNDRIFHLETDSPDAVSFEVPGVELLPITNRNVLHDVPRAHLTHPINPSDLIGIAERGIEFYADFLAKAEAFFITPS